MVKRFTTLFIIFITCCNLALAQKELKAADALCNSGRLAVSRQLRKQVKDSYLKATQILLAHPNTASALDTGPGKSIRPRLSGTPQNLYPDLPFLHNSSQLTNYFLTRHNRDLLQIIPQIEQWRREVIYNIHNFHESKKEITHPQEQDMAWLAHQITDNTKYLLIGEMHEREIKYQVSDLLDELRRQHPTREIFLFTEFLSSDQIGNHSFTSSQQIRVVGLEPAFVLENRRKELQYKTVSTDKKTLSISLSQNVWESLEGIRLRNAQWLAIIQGYRRHHPQALFIVYAGARHLSYNEPYSIGRILAGPTTFTAALFPTSVKQNGKITLLTSDFDELTRGEFLDRVLQFQDDQLSKLAGFDVRLRIPPYQGAPTP